MDKRKKIIICFFKGTNILFKNEFLKKVFNYFWKRRKNEMKKFVCRQLRGKWRERENGERENGERGGEGEREG